MSREIKFRAYDKVVNDIYPNIQNHINDEVFAFGHILNNKERFVVMQYTGLKDKNGKEIYEGDLCKNHTDSLGEIIFCKGMFCITGDYVGSFVEPNRSALWIWSDYIEVKGNVYQNPELIKEK